MNSSHLSSVIPQVRRRKRSRTPLREETNLSSLVLTTSLHGQEHVTAHRPTRWRSCRNPHIGTQRPTLSGAGGRTRTSDWLQVCLWQKSTCQLPTRRTSFGSLDIPGNRGWYQSITSINLVERDPTHVENHAHFHQGVGNPRIGETSGVGQPGTQLAGVTPIGRMIAVGRLKQSSNRCCWNSTMLTNQHPLRA